MPPQASSFRSHLAPNSDLIRGRKTLDKMGERRGTSFGLTTLDLSNVGNMVHAIGNNKLQFQPEASVI